MEIINLAMIIILYNFFSQLRFIFRLLILFLFIITFPFLINDNKYINKIKNSSSRGYAKLSSLGVKLYNYKCIKYPYDKLNDLNTLYLKGKLTLFQYIYKKIINNTINKNKVFKNDQEMFDFLNSLEQK